LCLPQCLYYIHFDSSNHAPCAHLTLFCHFFPPFPPTSSPLPPPLPPSPSLLLPLPRSSSLLFALLRDPAAARPRSQLDPLPFPFPSSSAQLRTTFSARSFLPPSLPAFPCIHPITLSLQGRHCESGTKSTLEQPSQLILAAFKSNMALRHPFTTKSYLVVGCLLAWLTCALADIQCASPMSGTFKEGDPMTLSWTSSGSPQLSDVTSMTGELYCDSGVKIADIPNIDWRQSMVWTVPSVGNATVPGGTTGTCPGNKFHVRYSGKYKGLFGIPASYGPVKCDSITIMPNPGIVPTTTTTSAARTSSTKTATSSAASPTNSDEAESGNGSQKSFIIIIVCVVSCNLSTFGQHKVPKCMFPSFLGPFPNV